MTWSSSLTALVTGNPPSTIRRSSRVDRNAHVLGRDKDSECQPGDTAHRNHHQRSQHGHHGKVHLSRKRCGFIWLLISRYPPPYRPGSIYNGVTRQGVEQQATPSTIQAPRLQYVFYLSCCMARRPGRYYWRTGGNCGLFTWDVNTDCSGYAGAISSPMSRCRRAQVSPTSETWSPVGATPSLATSGHSR